MPRTTGETQPKGQEMSVIDVDRYRWLRLQPGCGVIIQCRRCGRVACGRDMPQEYDRQGWNGYIPGDRGLHWARIHDCGPGVRSTQADLDTASEGAVLYVSEALR